MNIVGEAKLFRTSYMQQNKEKYWILSWNAFIILESTTLDPLKIDPGEIGGCDANMTSAK